MSRMIGTVSRGVRAPIIRSGDDLAMIVTNSVLEAAEDASSPIRDRDVVAMPKNPAPYRGTGFGSGFRKDRNFPADRQGGRGYGRSLAWAVVRP